MNIRSVGIIGFGNFGQFLFASTKEHFPNLTVKAYSPHKEPDGKDFFQLKEVCTTDIVLVCVPIVAFAETIDTVLPLLGEHTIVADVATVKIHTVAILQEKKVPNYIATHPMFGPFSYAKHGNSLKDLRIAICGSSLSKKDCELL